MKYIIVYVFLTLLSTKCFSQEKYFIFIQSENRLPFYISLSGKNYSSTASGYIIIPQVKDDDYTFAIGFANNQFPEQSFSYSIRKDVGLQLKNLADKGWGLFNFQTMALTMSTELKNSDVVRAKPAKEMDQPISFNVKKEVATKANEPSPNSMDSNRVQTDIVETNTSASGKEELKGKTEVQEGNSATDVKADVAVKKTPSKENNGDAAGKIKKIAEKSEEGDVSLTYTDKSGIQSDTIDIVIPAKEVVKSNGKAMVNSEKKVEKELTTNEDVSANIPNKLSSKDSSSNDLKDLEGQKNKTDVVELKEVGKLTERVREDCKIVALEDDYAKLRRKMSRETNDEDMMKEATKVFKSKCFSTSQIRALSTLFLSDQARYNFFETSFQYVADPGEYADLSKEFIDISFANRFRDMISK